MKKKILLTWLPLAVTITLLSGLIYGVAQYQLRAGANDPQIALTEDGVQKMAVGDVNNVVPKDQVDISKSLSTFVTVSDSKDNLQNSSATFNGAPVAIPAGVLAYARAHGKDTVTWQPAKDVRIALVVKSFEGGTVAAGRSLREVENRENWLMRAVVVGWLITLLSSVVTVFVIEKYSHKKQ